MSRTNGDHTTVYVGGLLEVDTDNVGVSAARTSYEFSGRAVAVREYESGQTSFLAQNHLGSPVATFNDDTDSLAELRYSPWGAERATSGTLPSDHRFTGQVSDGTSSASGGTDLLFYNARYYDSAVGAFVAADTIIPRRDTPSNLNRYAYVQSNPTNSIDPDGHMGFHLNLFADGGRCPTDDCSQTWEQWTRAIEAARRPGEANAEVVQRLIDTPGEREQINRQIVEAQGFEYQDDATPLSQKPYADWEKEHWHEVYLERRADHAQSTSRKEDRLPELENPYPAGVGDHFQSAF